MCNILMIFMPKRVPLKVSNKRTEKYIRKKLIQKIKLILVFILHDGKINSKKFSSCELTFGNVCKFVYALKFYQKRRQLFYYKMRQCYYKTRQVLQNTSISLQNVAGITQRVDYYKTRHIIWTLSFNYIVKQTSMH